MTAVGTRAHSRMAVSEFLDWDAGDKSGRAWPLIDGEPQAMAPASPRHAAIIAEVSGLIRNHLIDQRSGCRVLIQPGIVPRVRANENFRIPDLGVSCSPNMTGPVVDDPVLLIEILSPGNEAETRANVWAYTTIPSVQEILLLRSTRAEAELLRRLADGNWPAAPETLRPPATLQLLSLAYSVPLTALYRTAAIEAG